MEKIKRTGPRQTRGLKIFFKTVLITTICLVLIALGYFSAAYLSALF